MTTKSTIANIIDTARNWIVAGADTDNAEMKADHNEALAAYDDAIEAGDLIAAVNECISLARDWASNDRSGFEALDKLTDVIGEEFDYPVTGDDIPFGATENGKVVGFELLRGEWHVIVAWDNQARTAETPERLADFGLEVPA